MSQHVLNSLGNSPDKVASPSIQTGVYVLVTPVRNEEKFIGRTIASVTKQTILPKEWVIVSDGSTDETDEIIQRAMKDHDWIKLIQLAPRKTPSFAVVVKNTTLGIDSLSFQEYEYVGLLDSDLEFQNDYFESLIAEFKKEPKLGLAGGVAIDIGLPKDILPRNKEDVPGALQFFSRKCFEEMGGLIPIPEGGWDCLTCAVARMNNYETRLVTSLIVDHLKPRNITQGGALRRKWQLGVRDYAIGYHPLFEFIKCISRFRDRPFLINSISWWLGFCSASLSRGDRIVPAQVVAHVRSEQKARLKRAFGLRSSGKTE